MNGAVKNGLIIGVIGIVITTILYLMGPEAATGPFAYLSIPVSIGLYVYFGIQGRKDNGGYFTFGEAFKYIFTMGVVSTIISVLYSYVLYGIIDPEYMIQVNEFGIEKSREFMEAMGLGADEIDAAIEKAKEDNQGYTIKTALIGFFSALAVGAIGAAIIGAIIKKQNPEEADF